MKRKCSWPPPSSRLAITIAQLRLPHWLAPRGPLWRSYSPKANPWSMTIQFPAMRWRDGSTTASGIHVVPEPLRSMEIPNGPVIGIDIPRDAKLE